MIKIIINKENSSGRIDKFLAKEFFSYTRGEIIRNIKSGNVLVNDKKIKPSYALKEKDELKINISLRTKVLKPNSKVEFEIIYEDKNIIVINKPAGLQVHPSHAEKMNTLVNGLVSKFPETKNVGDDPSLRPGIVHRLDKDTSGVMVIARNQKTFNELKKLFQDREVKKEYLGVVFGKLKNKKGTIEKPIARSVDYRKQIISNAKTKTKIRPAVTEYEVLKEYDNYSLLKVVPKTGRMHQIRIHLSALGHPVVGDHKYEHKNNSPPPQVRRQFLHAHSLKFSLSKKKYSFTSEIPKDFLDFLAKLTEDK